MVQESEIRYIFACLTTTVAQAPNTFPAVQHNTQSRTQSHHLRPHSHLISMPTVIAFLFVQPSNRNIESFTQKASWLVACETFLLADDLPADGGCGLWGSMPCWKPRSRLWIRVGGNVSGRRRFRWRSRVCVVFDVFWVAWFFLHDSHKLAIDALSLRMLLCFAIHYSMHKHSPSCCQCPFQLKHNWNTTAMECANAIASPSPSLSQPKKWPSNSCTEEGMWSTLNSIQSHMKLWTRCIHNDINLITYTKNNPVLDSSGTAVVELSSYLVAQDKEGSEACGSVQLQSFTSLHSWHSFN